MVLSWEPTPEAVALPPPRSHMAWLCVPKAFPCFMLGIADCFPPTPPDPGWTSLHPPFLFEVRSISDNVEFPRVFGTSTHGTDKLSCDVKKPCWDTLWPKWGCDIPNLEPISVGETSKYGKREKGVLLLKKNFYEFFFFGKIVVRVGFLLVRGFFFFNF